MRYSTRPAVLALFLSTISLGCGDGDPAKSVSITSPDPVVTGEAGLLRVRLATRGVSRDADGYVLFVDDRSSAIPRNGALSITVSAAEHSLELVDIELGCAVQGSNPRTATVAAGGVTDVTFVVHCQLFSE